jgi:anti-sigma factor RsiW
VEAAGTVAGTDNAEPRVLVRGEAGFIRLGIELKGARVIAAGGFDTATWRSTGIGYSVEVRSDAPADQLAHLLEVVDQVAEIPQAIRAGATVRRVG